MILVTAPNTLHVMQGDLRLAECPDDVLVCILGSCVAACLRDPVTRIGGMNHFLLPGDGNTQAGNARYGVHSMEQLINAMLRKGAEKHRLEVWLFGGADLMRSSTGIGASNGKFATDFVRNEGLKLRGSDLGGRGGRRVRFHPYSGEREVALIDNAPVEKPVEPKRPSADIELF